ncbi:hypothetical protein EK21DRAFT_118556 [Setomelanomma holmii]|uniref:Uncharacterized protein n=1 Tax=Setomelanomma holmii TaxID=210430 RepID=A0A9P4GY46_9PLEO|nr:hypothetical protein EK21DRAFT_118556 [Setomelanomma holmii]
MACAVRTNSSASTRSWIDKKDGTAQRMSSKTSVQQLLRPDLVAPTNDVVPRLQQNREVACTKAEYTPLSQEHRPPISLSFDSTVDRGLSVIPEELTQASIVSSPSNITLKSSGDSEPAQDLGHITGAGGSWVQRLQLATTSAIYKFSKPSQPVSPLLHHAPILSHPPTLHSPSTHGSTDSSSLNTTSSIFSPSSFASSRTSIDTEGIFISSKSPDIYLWSREQKIFMGKHREQPVPEALASEWQTDIRGRLIQDLCPILQSLPHSLSREKTIVEPDFCMIGKLCGASDQVELRPTVVIRCGSKRCQKAIAEAVEDLGYLQSFSKKRAFSDTSSDCESDNGSIDPDSPSRTSSWLAAQDQSDGTRSESFTNTFGTSFSDFHPRDWVSSALGPYSYAGESRPLQSNNAYAVSDASDFALIEISEVLGKLPNSCRLSLPGLDNVETITSTKPLATIDCASVVSIVCSAADVRQGYLLDGDHVFLDRTTVFSTKNIQIESILKRGSSGAWVVQGSCLIGVIITVYDDEPYAHMLSITSVLSDIRALLSNGEHIPCITLAQKTLPSTNSQERSDILNSVPTWQTTAAQSTSTSTLDPKEKSTDQDAPLLDPENSEEDMNSPEYLEITSMRHKLGFAIITLACAYIHLYTAMSPFILSSITDSLGGLTHVGIYVTFYRLSADTVRPFYVSCYCRREPGPILLVALCIFQAGLLVSGLAVNSWMFAGGQAVAGIGSSVILAGISLLKSTLEFHKVLKYSTLHRHDTFSHYETKYSLPTSKRLTGIKILLTAPEWIDVLVGPCIAGAITEASKWCFCLYLIVIVAFVCVACVGLLFERNSIFSTSWDIVPDTEPTITTSWNGLMANLCIASFVIGLSYLPLSGWYSTLPWIGDPSLMSLLVNNGISTILLYLPLWFQSVTNFSITRSGVIFLATTLSAVSCDVAVRLFWDPQRDYRDLLIVTLSIPILAVGGGLLTSLSPSSELWKCVLFQVPIGIGSGMASSSLSWRFGRSKEQAVCIGISASHAIFLSTFRNMATKESVPDIRSIMERGANAWKDAPYVPFRSKLLAEFSKGLTKTFLVATVVIASAVPVIVVFQFAIRVYARLSSKLRGRRSARSEKRKEQMRAYEESQSFQEWLDWSETSEASQAHTLPQHT